MSGGRTFRLLGAVVTALMVLAAGRPAAAGREDGGCGGWEVVSAPHPGHSNGLFGVAAIPGTDDVWAVGYFHSNELLTDRTLIELWDGTRWRHVPSPSPGQENYDNNYLYGVTAISPTDAWAVGYRESNSGEHTLIEHWDGTRWSVVPSPNVSTYNSLRAVTAVSANDVWAVGKHLNTDGPVRHETLFLHWDGSTWSVVPSPNAPRDDNILTSIAAVPGSDLVAAAGYHQFQTSRALLEIWDGSRWRIGPVPQPQDESESLSDVAPVSENDVWTVGTTADQFDAFRGLAAHWDGAGWTEVPTPPPFGDRYDPFFTAVSAAASDDVWLVGQQYNPNGAALTLTEHWDGTCWRIVPSPSPGGPWHGAVSTFSDIVAVSGDDVWAVGLFHDSGFDPNHLLIEHYCP